MRDTLTGLYNRRYMEDALERYISLAERSGSSTSMLMPDLDKLQAPQRRARPRQGRRGAPRRGCADRRGATPFRVVCRYGGEELLAILPNCSLENGMLKAEMLRARIEGLSEVHDASVSASIGLASIPETSTSTDLVAMADAALYDAKRGGKNRVNCAARWTQRSSASSRGRCSAVQGSGEHVVRGRRRDRSASRLGTRIGPHCVLAPSRHLLRPPDTNFRGNDRLARAIMRC